MVPVLNSLGTHCAVFGNHDFGRKYSSSTFWHYLAFPSDFGLEALEGLVEKTEFPWLMSNVIGERRFVFSFLTFFFILPYFR